MPKTIHAQESKKLLMKRQWRLLKLKEAAKKVKNHVDETLAYCD